MNLINGFLFILVMYSFYIVLVNGSNFWKRDCRLQLISLVDLILLFGKCFAYLNFICTLSLLYIYIYIAWNSIVVVYKRVCVLQYLFFNFLEPVILKFPFLFIKRILSHYCFFDIFLFDNSQREQQTIF